MCHHIGTSVVKHQFVGEYVQLCLIVTKTGLPRTRQHSISQLEIVQQRQK